MHKPLYIKKYSIILKDRVHRKITLKNTIKVRKQTTNTAISHNTHAPYLPDIVNEPLQLMLSVNETDFVS